MRVSKANSLPTLQHFLTASSFDARRGSFSSEIGEIMYEKTPGSHLGRHLRAIRRHVYLDSPVRVVAFNRRAITRFFHSRVTPVHAQFPVSDPKNEFGAPG